MLYNGYKMSRTDDKAHFGTTFKSLYTLIKLNHMCMY